MTTHLNCLDEMVQMRGHNKRFYAELIKFVPNIINYSLLSRTMDGVCMRLCKVLVKCNIFVKFRGTNNAKKMEVQIFIPLFIP